MTEDAYRVTQLTWRTYSSGGVNHHAADACPAHIERYLRAADTLGIITRQEPVKHLPCMTCEAIAADCAADDEAHFEADRPLDGAQ